LSNDTRRRSAITAREIPQRILEGLERRIDASAPIPAAKLPELIQLRAIARELIAHINYLEEVQASQ
jgi:Flp pilus assembly CpaF family ATPase